MHDSIKSTFRSKYSRIDQAFFINLTLLLIRITPNRTLKWNLLVIYSDFETETFNELKNYFGNNKKLYPFAIVTP